VGQGYSCFVLYLGAELEFVDVRTRFEWEASITRDLKHPSSTRVIKTWRENGTAYTAMEYIEGRTLEQELQSGKRLSETQVVACMKSILEVLEELHNKGLLHRDIKPANIILGKKQAELIDYGSVTGFRVGERVIVTSRLVTPEYAPLEQFASEAELSPGTDFYALGATMYEALTGKPPPPSLERANGVTIKSLPLSAARDSVILTNLLEQMLEMKIIQRPQNARTVLNVLNDLDFLILLPSNQSRALKPWWLRLNANQIIWVLTIGIFVVPAVLGQVVQFAFFLLPGLKPQGNDDQTTQPVQTNVVETRVYVIPTWLENQSKPVPTVLINFVDAQDQAAFQKPQKLEINLWDDGFTGDKRKYLGYTKAQSWQILPYQIASKSGHYEMMGLINNEDFQPDFAVADDFATNSSIVKLEPLKHVQGRYNSSSDSFELLWNAPNGAVSFTISNIEKKSFADYFIDSKPTNNDSFGTPNFKIQNPKLYIPAFTITAMNVQNGFLENPKDFSKVVFSQVTTCVSILTKFKQQPNKLLPIKTGNCN
jgi:serine/threonine protein kinase